MTSATELDARYGRTPERARRTRVIALVAAAATVVIVVAWVIWVGLFSNEAELDSRDIGHSIISETEVEVAWDVSAPPGSAVSCVVQALNESFGTVGWKIVDLAPTEQRTRSYTETVRTSEPAVTGLIYRCWLT